MVMIPMGLGAKNDFAGENQQQLTRQTDLPLLALQNFGILPQRVSVGLM
jgi:hypothetical protein